MSLETAIMENINTPSFSFTYLIRIMGKEKEEAAQQPLSFSHHTLPPFLINIVHVVRLCLIMHDHYQQQNPLNEAPLNGNTIIPPRLRKKGKIVFPPFFCNKCSMGSVPATKCIKVHNLEWIKRAKVVGSLFNVTK